MYCETSFGCRSTKLLQFYSGKCERGFDGRLSCPVKTTKGNQRNNVQIESNLFSKHRFNKIKCLETRTKLYTTYICDI